MNLPMNTLGIVKRNIERADPAAVDKLSRFGVATVHEAMGRVGLMKPTIRPIYAGAHLCGTAVTVLLQPGDNWMLHVAAEQIQPGDVVVAGCTADSTDGFFGDLLATSYKSRGAAGLIIDGGVRDVKDLTAMGFPVFTSRTISAPMVPLPTRPSLAVLRFVRPSSLVCASLPLNISSSIPMTAASLSTKRFTFNSSPPLVVARPNLYVAFGSASMMPSCPSATCSAS